MDGSMDAWIGNIKKNKQTTNSTMCNMILNIRKMHRKKKEGNVAKY